VNGRVQAGYLNRNWSTQVLGTGVPYASMRAAQPDVGRFFTEDEVRRRARVAVIGRTLLDKLFDGQDPIGETIRLNKVSFQVIGVLPEKGANAWRDQDDLIVIPVQTAMYRLLGKNYVDYIDIEVNSAEEIESTQQALEALMFARHRIPGFAAAGCRQHPQSRRYPVGADGDQPHHGLLLSAIAAISLLVGASAS